MKERFKKVFAKSISNSEEFRKSLKLYVSKLGEEVDELDEIICDINNKEKMTDEDYNILRRAERKASAIKEHRDLLSRLEYFFC